MRLRDRVVVVTGAGGGIGRAIARAFAAEGAGLVLGDLGAAVATVAENARRDGGRAVTLEADVTRGADMAALAALADREFGRVDVLVTCAGLGDAGLLTEQDEREWLRVIDVNLNGTYRAIRAVLPQMMAQRSGRIVTIASVMGRIGGFGYVTAYVASKHGVIGLTRALAAELGAQGFTALTINALCPGYVRAGMGVAAQPTKAGPLGGEEIFERYFKRLVPQRRMIEVEEIAGAAVFLALPESAGITGQALNVDGGFVMS
ncbi:MAG: SDR family oxidoreductase [Candidatus Rokubacteria bacterium]|nr:SDR family oxidoreductase [Candidatus Rokubacteria bacterium]